MSVQVTFTALPADRPTREALQRALQPVLQTRSARPTTPDNPRPSCGPLKEN